MTRLCLIDMTVIIVLVYIIVFLLKFVMLLYNGDVNGVHAIDCLGRMIMGSNQHYRWVLEVKWSTVVVSRTNPIKGGQILTPPISVCVLWMLQMLEHKTKDTYHCNPSIECNL